MTGGITAVKNTLSEQLYNIHLPREVLKKRMQQVIREELTQLQRYTLVAYYIRDLSIPESARERGVNKATVWRTLRRAEDRLKRYLRY